MTETLVSGPRAGNEPVQTKLPSRPEPAATLSSPPARPPAPAWMRSGRGWSPTSWRLSFRR